jgi:hypothetical protein
MKMYSQDLGQSLFNQVTVDSQAQPKTGSISNFVQIKSKHFRF